MRASVCRFTAPIRHEFAEASVSPQPRRGRRTTAAIVNAFASHARSRRIIVAKNWSRSGDVFLSLIPREGSRVAHRTNYSAGDGTRALYLRRVPFSQPCNRDLPSYVHGNGWPRHLAGAVAQHSRAGASLNRVLCPWRPRHAGAHSASASAHAGARGLAARLGAVDSAAAYSACEQCAAGQRALRSGR